MNDAQLRGGVARPSDQLIFYQSAASPCPYLAGRRERRLLIELTPHLVESGLFSALTASGFRRSHNYLYRPACRACNACVPVRIVVERFRPRRTLGRIWRANQGLAATLAPARASFEHFDLFARYQSHRHEDGDMASMDYADFTALIESCDGGARLLELRDPGGALVGCCLLDETADGYSAVYSFFDADQPSRSLGAQTIMALVGQARAAGKSYVYLGYWIAECRKMAYKARFKPLEALGPDGWRAIDPADLGPTAPA